MQPEQLDLTVQYYRPEDTGATPSSTQDILNNAERLVFSVTKDVRWYNPPSSNSLSFAIGANCYQWDRETPTSEKNTGVHGDRTITEWEEDVAVKDDELWALPDLEEFDHSRLHRLLDLQPPPPALCDDSSARKLCSPVPTPRNMAVCRKRSPEQDAPLTSQTCKRPKIDESSLRDIIPEPHFFPSRATTDDPGYQLPLLKLQYAPIPPHTLASAMDYIQDPYARLAWIIPVRGRLQWDGATAASVLACSHDPSAPVSDGQLPSINSDSSGTELIWTRDSLNDLWNVVKTLREGGRFGPLSLSFHVAMPAALASSMEQYSYVGSHKQASTSISISLSSSLSIYEPQTQHNRLPLRAIDYIKVYHDAKYTMNLRTVLRAWSYEKAGQKIRLLKEAKLVLVDELSRGLVIC
ncbi:hypothetical protein L226DRAFT_461455 [Lentinus tigrinus ALCF2SS1-7]|uniref:Uncharacterized protein n=1 Tax=Lentinus tigrinus ALCF2SS1-6 TaxID=1328759 RepID=A0A5C2SCY9_9APHY|nr:hypothetical protein L227DRAFT_500005 [Lentinus tigrinus ALCF2SS1-6]RPD76195.1 hypothetical protein L226DRAFT_461455 [Lentinus tigrinus ALCF2SS1-7]